MQNTAPQFPSERTLLDELAQTRKHVEDALNQIVVEQQRLKHASGRLYEAAVGLRRSVSLASSDNSHLMPRKAPSRSEGALGILAPRERQVLKLIAEGLSTKEIAGQLRISFKTAVCYRTRLLQKLNVHESASLVRLAIRTGLLSA